MVLPLGQTLLMKLSVHWLEQKMSDPTRPLSDVFNVTKMVPIEYAPLVYGTIMPILVVITFITNSLIILVLLKRHMATPTNLVLLWIAIEDLDTMLPHTPWYWYLYTMGSHTVLLSGSAWCYAYSVITEHVPVFLQTTSIWLTSTKN